MLLTVATCLITITIYAQKSYHFEITFSGTTLDHKKMGIQFEEGYQTRSIDVESLKIIENRTSFLNFPTLNITYSSTKHGPTKHRFFLMAVTSILEFDYDSINDDIKIQKTSGVLNFKDAGEDKFEIFAKKELERRDKFVRKHNYDFSRADSTVMKEFDLYSEAVIDKALAFVKTSPQTLYSIWLFRAQIIWDTRYSKNALSQVYQRFLSKKYKNTFEGNYILTKLDANRLGMQTRMPGQELDFKDLAGNMYSLKSFLGKPFIIMIWATWCVPCVAEIPRLKEISGKYKGTLEVVAFSTDTNEGTVRHFVTTNKIDWINVHGRRDLCRIYGSDLGIPQVYLIDKDGFIIYSRLKMEDYDLNKLEKFVAETCNPL